jgi:4-hydroxy-tetrahydrodipicolinate reductase
MKKIKVLVLGASGRMGREVIKSIAKEPDLELAGAVDPRAVCDDPAVMACLEKVGVKIAVGFTNDFKDAEADVVVDFTHPSVVFENCRTMLSAGKKVVVGTTGLSQAQIKELEKMTKDKNTACLVAPNFAIGAVLMMKFAELAAKFMDNAEVIELHHDKKADAPSGTALLTAERVAAVYQERGLDLKPAGGEKISGVRGGDVGGVKVHSVRLPGLVAHQEVLFGGLGQMLTIRHDSLSRESFMPGVMLAVKKIASVKGFYYGLEKLIEI